MAAMPAHRAARPKDELGLCPQLVGSHSRRLTPSRAPHIAHVINPTPLSAQDCFSELASPALANSTSEQQLTFIAESSTRPTEPDGAPCFVVHSISDAYE